MEEFHEKKTRSTNHVIESTVGTAQEAGQRVPQLDGIVAAGADHAACLGICATHVRIPTEVIDQLMTTNLCCQCLHYIQTDTDNKYTILLSASVQENSLYSSHFTTIKSSKRHPMQLQKLTWTNRFFIWQFIIKFIIKLRQFEIKDYAGHAINTYFTETGKNVNLFP